MFKKIFLLFISIFGFAQEQTKPISAFDFLKKYSNTRDLALSQNQDEVYSRIMDGFELPLVCSYEPFR